MPLLSYIYLILIQQMKRLFLLVAVIGATFMTACDNNKGEVDDGTVKMNTVSEDILTFNFLGGEHSSYYTIKNIPQDSIIVAKSSQPWVNSFVTKNIGEVRYVIEPNDSGAKRETTMTVSCEDAVVEYSISQLTPDVTCKAAYAECNYYGTSISDNPNFQLTISLKSPGHGTNSNISYSLDLYRQEPLKPGDPLAIPLGTYNLDPINNGDKNVIYPYGSGCTMIDGTNLTFMNIATLEVKSDRLIFYAKTNDGRWHLATYYGAYKFNDMSR